MPLLVTGAITSSDGLLLATPVALLAAHVSWIVSNAYGETGEGRSARQLAVAGCFLLCLVAAIGAAFSAVVAIFLGFAKAFRWMAVLLPLVVAGLVADGLLRRLAGRLVRGKEGRRRGHSSGSRLKSTS